MSLNDMIHISIISAQYIVPTSSFNCGHIHISSRIQIGAIDLPSSDLVCISGLVNSECRKEMVRAVLTRVQAIAPQRLLLTKV